VAALSAPVFLLIWLIPMDSSTATGDPLTILVNYGGLGLAFGLVLVGRLRTPNEVVALNARIDSLEKLLKERDEQGQAKDSLITALTQAITQRTIPAMSSTSAVLEAIPQTESALANLLRESMAQTAALTARLDASTKDGP
jgi:dihydroxyacetone kinase